jgi:hypothetical protein
MKYLNRVVEVLEQWQTIGERTTKFGTRLIGHVPHVGDMAYLHLLYKSLNNSQIIEIEQRINKKIPEHMKDFYSFSNGATFFLTLELQGKRDNYDRTLNDNVYQPIDLEYQNILDKPKNSTEEMFFFGGYDWDGSNLFTFTNDKKIYLCAYDDASEIYYEWDSFEDFIVTEIERLSKLYDKDGRKIDKNIPTIPYS